MKFLKQCVGIDAAKDTFSVAIGLLSEDQSIKLLETHVFKNDSYGFSKFDDWVNQHAEPGLPTWYIMEATGVYYENLAYHLLEYTRNISVMMPSRVKFFARSLQIKSKTDLIDAKILVRLGLERKVKRWNILSPIIKRIKSLCREYRINKIDLNRFKNRKHALERSYKPDIQILKRLIRKIELLENHCLAIELELREIVMTDEKLADKFDKLSSIPGLGFITIACIIGETNGFAAVQNARQLSSYAGLDVVHSESGAKSKKPRISKHGNKYLRLAMYMPAICALQHNEHLKDFYHRVKQHRSSKKIGVIAVARKLLVLAYSLWKNDEYFHPLPNRAIAVP